MRILSSNDTAAIERLATRNRAMDPDVVRQAARIIRDVRRRGETAVAAWTRRLDGYDVRPGHFEMSRRELARGWDDTPRDVRAAIRLAIRNVRRVALEQRQRPFSLEVQPGVRVEQRVQPLERVGCYVPGGRYPLPSTVVMTVTPAVVAGVGDITLACPWPHPAVLCAALEAGATRVLRAGGAQAIAALAYGTRSIARVDKIAGPGNAWVAAAKTLVSRDCAIDFQAGPSEIVICSDDGRADWIAADLIAQAEHDPDARAILVTTKRTMARDVAAAVSARMPLAGPARRALRRHGAIVVAASREAATRLVNRIAPEHLVCDRSSDASRFNTAGTIFVGRWSAQASGDYVTGSNHVLPTGGAGRFRGGLSTADFVRTFTVQTVTRRGLGAIARSAIALARAEGLTSHADSIEIRL
jgi:histidinol dehydrogenase